MNFKETKVLWTLVNAFKNIDFYIKMPVPEYQSSSHSYVLSVIDTLLAIANISLSLDSCLQTSVKLKQGHKYALHVIHVK